METKNKNAFGTQKLDDERRIRVLSPGMLVFKRFVRNRLAITGLVILILMFAFSFLGGILSPYGQSQVFKHDEEIMKEYATCMMSTDMRFTVRPGAEFPETAHAEAMLAISKGNTSFTYGERTYSLVKEGEEFYTIGDALKIASTRTLAGKFSLSVEEATGFVASSQFTAAAQAALQAKKTQFDADGTSYTITIEGKNSSIYHVESIALATKRVFDPYDEADKQLTTRNNLELGTLYLLLHIEVGYAFDVLAGALYLIADGEHAVEVGAEELDGDACLRAGEHGVNAV